MANYGTGNQRKRPVYCITTGKYFCSMAEAAECYGLSHGSVWYRCARSKKLHYNGKHADLAFCYADDMLQRGVLITSFDKIRKNINAKMYQNVIKVDGKKLPENHVFDEDKTVRENRKMVELHNATVDAQYDNYKNENIRILSLLKTHLKDAIKCESNLNDASVDIILNKSIDSNNSITRIVDKAENLCAFACELMSSLYKS